MITWLIGLGSLFSFNLLEGFTIFGMSFFDLLDGFTSKIMLPLGGLLMAIFVGFIVKRNVVKDELNMNSRVFTFWRLIIRFVAPIAVTLIFINGFI